jgi:hypothetical protein
MTLYEASRQKSSPECWDGSPTSAVNNSPGSAKGRYVFLFFDHPGCENGGKAFGVLGAEQAEPALPNVQSYTWQRYD